MDRQRFKAIADSLDAAKLTGDVSEYLMSWVGSSGNLSPRVTVWCTDTSGRSIKYKVEKLLEGLVAERDIMILTD